MMVETVRWTTGLTWRDLPLSYTASLGLGGKQTLEEGETETDLENWEAAVVWGGSVS